MEKSKVYFSKEITPENVIKMYEKLGVKLPGKVAIKLHSGEHGNQNYLRAEFVKPMIEYLKGTVVECNTAYDGARNSTPNGKVIKENYVGKNLKNYDSMLVLSHFKGHPMGGFGGAIKQLSIGVSSSAGKSWIHSAGKTLKQEELWDNVAKQDDFLEAMADAAESVVKYFEDKIVYINIMCNLSVDCDCCAVAEDPCMKDIGILASTDPIAIDQACVDLIYNSKDPGRDHFVQRIERQNGIHTIEAANELGFGTREYELISID